MRKGTCINTYSGVEFYPLSPKEDEIKIEDIAHALSLVCRGNGHVKYFFSVAQHSINCYLEAKARGYSREIQLGCLLHDASEAYLSDITRPVKKELSEYLAIEKNLQGEIYKKFNVNIGKEEVFSKIKLIDDEILKYEMLNLLNVDLGQANLKGSISLEYKDILKVKEDFLDYFNLFSDLSKNGKND
ncbi:MAG: hypothetical protein Q7K47_06360 [Fusobacterium sp. JB019]|nr:hypothetical protein [Fusobacterium sp. JB019]